MRSILIPLLVSASAWTLAQGPQGAYRNTNGLTTPWSINENHTLIWDGKPFIPVGLRVNGSTTGIQAAQSKGIKDLLVELPANGLGWKDAISALELGGLRYMVAIDSLAPGAAGYAIEPQSYRVTGITSERNLDLAMPGVTSALAVLAMKRDSSVAFAKRVKVVDGRFRLKVQSPNQLEHILLIYPETVSISVIDSWDAMDDHRDALMRAFRTSPFGIGMRGIVNPLGAMIRQPSERMFVPSSPRFQSELAGYLEQKYRNIESVQRAWSMSTNDAASFADLARLAPLWSGTRGVQFLWDPKTDRLIQVEAKRSLAWADIRTVLSMAESKRFQRLVAAIRQVCDVPVIQEWVGWNSYYEQPNPILDGIACQTSGTNFTSLMDTAGRAASSLNRWLRKGLSLASSVDLRGEPAATPVSGVAEDLFSCGFRGIYFRSDDPAHYTSIVAEATKRADDKDLATYSPRAVFFPENALNPANIQRLPGGRWWLPSPEAGNRIDLGSLFSAYRISGAGGSKFVLWSNRGVQRVRLRLADTTKVKFVAVDGSDPDPRVSRGRLEVTIGQSPLIVEGSDEIPVPQQSLDEALLKFSILEKDAEKYRMDITEESFSIRDANSSFDRNPGGSYTQMLAGVNKINARLARYMWIEAENTAETTFSEVLNISGCSGGSALNLRSPFEGAANDYVSEYGFTSRSGEELEVWIAARIPRESRGDVNLLIGSQLMKITTEPVSLYGAGFGWYKVGTTRLGGVRSNVQVRVFPKAGAEMAIDALLFCPGTFTPSGVRQPDAVNFNVAPPDKSQ